MNPKSRTANSMLNISVSVGMQILLLLTSFISRTVFIRTLGEQYLGISGLYTNILSLLSLADLGINTAMIYALYKPIAQNDTDTISELIYYFKKLYLWVATVVLALGLLCVPFLQFMVNGSTLPLSKLRLYYILFLGNTVCSYLIVYKATLISADQRVFINRIIDFIAALALQALQIIILVITNNYVLYLVSAIGITLLKNGVLSYISNRIYPFLRQHGQRQIDADIKARLKENIKSIFLYKVSATVMNSTDNILISVILGTVVVGQYSNYLMITMAINTFIMLIAQSVIASLGNFNAIESAERKLLILRCMLLFFYFVATFCSCCFLSMFNDFIDIWVGGINPDYVLSDFSVFAITFNFFVSCVLNPIWMFRESTGLFNQVKYSMTFAAIINIGLSVVLGKLIGLGGIVGATALSKLMTNFWYEPRVLFREVFHTSTRKYWLYIARLLGMSLPCMILCTFVGRALNGSIAYTILKIVISGLITGAMFLVFNRNSEEYVYLRGIITNTVLRKRSGSV